MCWDCETGDRHRRKKLGVGDVAGVEVLCVGASCAVECPALFGPSGMQHGADKGKVRDLLVVVVLVSCSVAAEGPLTWDLPLEELPRAWSTCLGLFVKAVLWLKGFLALPTSHPAV